MNAKCIIYLCPQGRLSDQIDLYFKEARAKYQWNPAHDYMPHCTLTGFFHDSSESLPLYLKTMDTALSRLWEVRPDPIATVQGLLLKSDFHGLRISAPWLKEVIAVFTQEIRLLSLPGTIRVKNHLHLSLAYNFQPDENDQLKSLATQTVGPDSQVNWELRFYQHNADQSWICHRKWQFG
jgi:hypothetical protein